MINSEFARLENVKFTYAGGDSVVVDIRSLQFDAGTVLGVVGESGIGKTTLLKLIVGLLNPDSGSIHFAKTNCRFGVVFQTPTLLPWKSVLNNALMSSIIDHSVPTEEEQNHAEYLLRKYGLWDFRNYYPSALSGGMQQRVSIIRALASSPDILLLDEPFSALDFSLRNQFLTDIDKYVETTGTAVFYVTHDLDDATRLCDKIVLLSKDPARVGAEINFSASRHDRLNELASADEEVLSARREIRTAFHLSE